MPPRENKQLFTSNKSDWNTPPEVLDVVRKLGPISLDPCGNATSVGIVKAKTTYRLPEQDGLVLPWACCRPLVFVNPPYTRAGMPRWAAKIAREGAEAQHLVALVAARTETHWFRYFWNSANAICFWYGRIKFLGTDGQPVHGATFPSALPYYGDEPYGFEKIFEPHGKVVVLRHRRL